MISDKPIQIADLPDTNDRKTDLRQIRQQVADAFGVSTTDVAVQFEEGLLQASVKTADGATTPTVVCLEFTDSKDVTRMSTFAGETVSPVLKFDYGKGDGTGPVVVGRMVSQSEGLARGENADVLVPRLQATLAREFKCPADQIELRWQTDATIKAHSLAVRRVGQTDWRPVTFGRDSEGANLTDFIRKGPERQTLSSLGAVQTEPAKALVVPALSGTHDERLQQVRLALSEPLGVPPERVILKEAGGLPFAVVVPASAIGAAWDRLSERSAKGTPVALNSSADTAWLMTEMKLSASDQLSTLGARSVNPHTVTIGRIAPDLGRDAVVQGFKDDIKRALGTGSENIDLTIKDGIFQARVKGADKVWDIKIPDANNRQWLLQMQRDNPTSSLDTFGERALNNRYEVTANTGYPDLKGATSFGQNFRTDYNFGQHSLRAGVIMTEGIGSFQLGEARLGYHHRQYGGLDVRLRPGGFDVTNIESKFATKAMEKFGANLLKGEKKEVLITSAVLVAAAGAVWIASNSKKELKLDLPIDADIFNNGKLQIKAGVRGTLLTGGEKKLGLEFGGAKLGFRENIATGIVSHQNFDFDQETGSLKGQLAGSFNRFNYDVKTDFDTKTGAFNDSQFGASQSFALTERAGVSFSGGLGLNGQGKLHDPSLGMGVSYQRGDVWNFRLNLGASAPGTGSTWKVGAGLGVVATF
ncbi:MAG: hypothetical protein H7338_07355 [Candidatus Sericytochromatia bacterium]|nr:hypothetical protein [Candidatus Sericytochromatia bacterium]